MKAIPLNAELRTITGKKVKKLRAQGLLPVDVYGKEMESVSLTVPVKDFMTVYHKAGATGVVELSFGSDKKPTLIKHVQNHPVTRQPLHAEFQAVKLSEKIKANVPVELEGESPAVANNTGILLQTLNEVEVEALPMDLPEKILVPVSALSEIDQRVLVSELAAPAGVEILTNPEEVVVSVASAVSEETQKEMDAEEAAKEAATEGAEGAEGGEAKAEGSEGETKAEGEETSEKAE